MTIMIFGSTVPLKSQENLNTRISGIQRGNCVIAELTSSGKRAIIRAPQQCPEAPGLPPESRGVVL